nr:hypothetical protein CFP56_22023 [Quercus suber]
MITLWILRKMDLRSGRHVAHGPDQQSATSRLEMRNRDEEALAPLYGMVDHHSHFACAYIIRYRCLSCTPSNRMWQLPIPSRLRSHHDLWDV